VDFGRNSDELIATHQNDPTANSTPRSTVWDGNIGIALRSDHSFVGVSLNQILPSKVQFFNPNSMKMALNFMAGHRVKIAENVGFVPALLVRMPNMDGMQPFFNGTIKLKDSAWGGVTVGLGNSVAVNAGFSFNNSIMFNYAYETNTSEIGQVAGNTHEVSVGLRIGTFDKKRARRGIPNLYE
jgi:type IX secretion system PorP/SprF family membrane protein